MDRNLIQNLVDSSDELKVMIQHGKEQAARSDADSICRLSDEAIAEYEAVTSAIDELTSRFPRMRRKLDASKYTTTPPEGCPFKAGDYVTFTNDYGVVFKGIRIYGFALKEDWLHGTDYVYTEDGAYWFPNSIGCFELESRPRTSEL